MPRKSITVIVSIILLSFLIVAILYAISDEPFSYRQNFTREFDKVRVVKKHVLDLKDNSYYIAGATNSKIFLGNEKDSLNLLITDTLLSAPQHVQLSIPNENGLPLKGSHIEIDSPFFFIKAGELPGIFKGKMDHWQATRILDSIVFFDLAMPMTKGSFAFQTIGGTAGSTNQNILGKISTDNRVDLNPELLKGQVDNYFSTLGVLRYSKKLSKLVYTYFYRNQYLVIDTNLNLQYKASTIDTTTQAHIKPVEVSRGNYTLASTPAIVNRNAQVYENLLFIHSNLMAVNEVRETFDHSSVIDVYDLEENKYRLSFYLPDHENIKMTTFKVFKNTIIALYGNYALAYSLGNNIVKDEGI